MRFYKKNQKEKSKSSKCKKTLNEKHEKRQKEFDRIHTDFNEKLKNYESQPGIKIKCSSFCRKYHSDRFKGHVDGDCIPSCNTLKKWFHEFHGDTEFKPNNQGGRRETHVKLTPDVITCFVCTLLDFPTWTLTQRTAYINGDNGATKKDIKVSTIERDCENLRFTVHTTRYSPPARNSFGLRALRINWSKYFSQLIQNGSACFIFVDEAGLSFVPRNNKCRGFEGVTPLTLRNLQFSRISIVVAVVPGYGVIYQWSKGKSIKGDQYKNFLCQVSDIVRRFIGNGKIKLALIHENASIHWTKDVTNTIHDLQIELIPTVPYSPQLNYLAECYIAIIKSLLANIDIPPFVDDDVIEMIKYKWDVATILGKMLDPLDIFPFKISLIFDEYLSNAAW